MTRTNFDACVSIIHLFQKKKKKALSIIPILYVCYSNTHIMSVPNDSVRIVTRKLIVRKSITKILFDRCINNNNNI